MGGWLVLAGVLWSLAPPFAEVATFDDTSFLGEDAPAIKGGRLLQEGWPGDDFARNGAVVLARERGELTAQDEQLARDLAAWFASDASPDAFGQVTTHLDDPQLTDTFVADDGQAMFFLVGLTVPPFTPPANEAVATARDHLDQVQPPPGLSLHLTGSAAVAADEAAAIDASVNRTHVLTLALVAAILLWVYRSPVAPLVPLATILVSFVVSLALVSLLAQAGMEVASLYETFSIVIVFGAGTDYCLFIVSRYHEELNVAEDLGYARGPALRRGTLTATMIVLGGVVASSAGTTIAGFSSQAVAEFGMFRTMGPAMAIAIAITLLVALTLAPALMRMFGRALFWPNLPVTTHFDTDEPLVAGYEPAELGLEERVHREPRASGR